MAGNRHVKAEDDALPRLNSISRRLASLSVKASPRFQSMNCFGSFKKYCEDRSDDSGITCLCLTIVCPDLINRKTARQIEKNKVEQVE